MDEIDKDVLEAVAEALTEGQGDFSEKDLAVAYKEIEDSLRQGAIAQLVLDGRITMQVQDGKVLYTTPGEKPSTPTPLLRIIENP